MNMNPLDTLDPRLLGEELKRSRRQRGLRQEDVAKLINVSRTTVVAIEQGERRIKAEELVELAYIYGKPVSDFLRPRRVVVPLHAAQFRGPTVQEEKYQEEIAVSISVFEDLCNRYLELSQLLKITESKRYPIPYQRSGVNLDAEAEGLALSERSRLGLGAGPLPAIRDILEQDVGIKVFFIPMRPGNLSGIYHFNDELGACIAINSNHGEDRRRWTMCHDYCHFLADRYEPTVLIEDGYQRKPASERFADLFPKHFLLPGPSVTQRFNEIYSEQNAMTFGGLCTLAHRFGVSVEAITRRLEDLKLMKAGAWERLKDRNPSIRKTQEELGLEPLSGRDSMFPIKYHRMAYDAYRQGKISEEQLASYLHLDQVEARKQLSAMQHGSDLVLDDEGSGSSGGLPQ